MIATYLASDTSNHLAMLRQLMLLLAINSPVATACRVAHCHSYSQANAGFNAVIMWWDYKWMCATGIPIRSSIRWCRKPIEGASAGNWTNWNIII